MKIVYVALRDDYGDPRRGPSFEEQNFYPALRSMGHEVIPFDFVRELKRQGYEAMNRDLLRLVRELEPDLLFCILFEEQLDRRVIREISEQTSTVTFNWFCDDHWRFDRFSRFWAPCFNWYATTDEPSFARYGDLGIPGALFTQWACNPEQYRPVVADRAIDVSFVGQPYGNRRRNIDRLRRRGIRVSTWGSGWDEGRLTFEEMVEVFSASKINLNFSRASVGTGRLFRRHIYQVKARLFEIAACGGFVLTEHAPGIDRWLTPGKEIVTFRSGDDLVRQVRSFLGDEEARTEIARHGCDRVRREHTYQRRLEELFSVMGLSTVGRPALT